MAGEDDIEVDFVATDRVTILARAFFDRAALPQPGDVVRIEPDGEPLLIYERQWIAPRRMTDANPGRPSEGQVLTSSRGRLTFVVET